MQLAGPNICASCVHLSKTMNPVLGVPTTCTAFPTGIPGTYFSGGAPHFESDGRDNGITWELDPAKENALLRYKESHPELEL